jgi:hypothetical protein
MYNILSHLFIVKDGGGVALLELGKLMDTLFASVHGGYRK